MYKIGPSQEERVAQECDPYRICNIYDVINKMNK